MRPEREQFERKMALSAVRAYDGQTWRQAVRDLLEALDAERAKLAVAREALEDAQSLLVNASGIDDFGGKLGRILDEALARLDAP